jgi:hypothetical protein
MRLPAVLLPPIVLLFLAAALSMATTPARHVVHERAQQTTELARELVLERIDAIERNGRCRQEFGKEMIDLDHVRMIVRRIRFYNAEGPEGDLRFSEVVGRPASPDSRLRDLSRGLSADAFVLGYPDNRGYIRTRNVVLSRGYFEQGDPSEGTWRLRSREEKQALLLHEALHIALDKDDDDLSQRELCPLRLLAFCPRTPAIVVAGSE